MTPSNRTNSLKDPELYEKLRDEGDSKEKAARISNAAAARGRSAVGRTGGKAGDYDDMSVAEARAPLAHARAPRKGLEAPGCPAYRFVRRGAGALTEASNLLAQSRRTTMTLAEPIEDRPARQQGRHAAYRELWKTDRGDATAKVRDYLDGTQEIEGRPDVAPADVRAALREGGLHFVRLLRPTSG